MTDVTLNNPELRLVHPSGQSPARASTSPQAEGRNASQPATDAGRSNPTSFAQQSGQLSQVQRQEKLMEKQEKSVDEAVSKLNDFVQSVQRDLQFEVDKESGQTVVRVVDRETEEVIRQIPDEVAMRLAEKLQQDEPLTLFNAKV